MPPVAPRGPGRVVQVGLALCALGLLAILVDVLPFFAGADDRPLWLNLACLLLPVGLVVAFGAVLVRGRREQKAAFAAVERARRT